MKMERQTFNELTCSGSVMRFCQEMAIVGPVFDGDEALKPLISDKDYLTFRYDDEIMKVFNEGKGSNSPPITSTEPMVKVGLDHEETDKRMMVYFRKLELRNERMSE